MNAALRLQIQDNENTDDTPGSFASYFLCTGGGGGAETIAPQL